MGGQQRQETQLGGGRAEAPRATEPRAWASSARRGMGAANVQRSQMMSCIMVAAALVRDPQAVPQARYSEGFGIPRGTVRKTA